jgi:N-methylhydantoinase B
VEGAGPGAAERASAGWSKAVHAIAAGLQPDGSRYVMFQWAGAPAGGASRAATAST